MMLTLQHEPVDALYYYDTRIGPSCCGNLFNCETKKPNNTYFIFHMFNALYQLKSEVKCKIDSEDVYAMAASNGKRSVLVIANTANESIEIDLALSGVDLADAEVLRIDGVYRYTLTGERIKENKLTLPAYGCAEIRFY